MINRIFDPEPAIDLTLDEEESGFSAGPQRQPPAASKRSNRPQRQPPTTLLFTVLGGVCMVSAISSMLWLSHWNQMQQSLRQERNLLLMKQLRRLGPVNPEPVAGVTARLQPTNSAQQHVEQQLQGDQAVEAETLPPPRLAVLAPVEPRPAPLLRVPVSSKITAPAPPVATTPPAPLPASAPESSHGLDHLPQLVGVVAVSGRPGSAIFQLGQTSTSVNVGGVIGDSGWILRSAAADTATIERDGVMHQVSISNGY